jgi:hypothetical protein
MPAKMRRGRKSLPTRPCSLLLLSWDAEDLYDEIIGLIRHEQGEFDCEI